MPIRAGAFTVTFFRVSHSVPDSAALLIEADGARLVHSGDFKLDDDPPDGETTDREGLAAAVGAGVDLALVDSTNAERPGRSRVRADGRRGPARGVPRRPRADRRDHVLQPRRAALAGRGGRARLAAGAWRSSGAACARSPRSPSASAASASRRGHGLPRPSCRETPPERLLCLTSGSQGEPFSALYRLALDEHADLALVRRRPRAPLRAHHSRATSGP